MRETKAKTGTKQKVVEAKNVCIYKKLLVVFGEFIDQNPMTGVDTLFDQMVEQGIKILPKDKRGLDILEFMISEYDSPAMCVQKILNMRFRNLPACLKPIAKAGRRHEIAFWCKDKEVFDQVKSLLNFGSQGKGFWADANGDKVTLLDTVA